MKFGCMEITGIRRSCFNKKVVWNRIDVGTKNCYWECEGNKNGEGIGNILSDYTMIKFLKDRYRETEMTGKYHMWFHRESVNIDILTK
jgi:hypothetical protein